MTGKPSPENPAALRNAGPILDVLRPLLPADARVFEVASGRGHHAIAFSKVLEGVRWHTSEADPELLAHMHARFAGDTLPGVVAPVRADMCDPGWADTVRAAAGPYDAVFNVNMIHVAPWSACLGLLSGAARILSAGGVVFLYGPFSRDGAHTSAGNAAFDRSLRAQNPEWGLRDLSQVCDAARDVGLVLDRLVEMPVNNLSVVFRTAI